MRRQTSKSSSSSKTTRRLLGTGGFGSVFLETNRGKQYAVKRFTDIRGVDIPHQVLRELSMIKILDHPNIVKLVEVRGIDDDQDIEMVMPHCGIDLREYIKRHPYQHRISQVQIIMQQVLSAVRYIHLSFGIHRDLKPDNILILNPDSAKPHVTICDLGLCKLLAVMNEHHNSAKICTLYYRAIELFAANVEIYSQAIDMWSIGALGVEIITGKILFDGETEIITMSRILSIVPTTEPLLQALNLDSFKIEKCNTQSYFKLPAFYDYTLTDPMMIARLRSYQDLIESLLNLDPSKRPDADTALRHPFFNGLPVPPYISEVRLSARHPPEPHYMSPSARAKYVEYMFEYGRNSPAGVMGPSTVFLCIDVFDRYVCRARPKITSHNLAIICACIIYMCSKYMDVVCVNIDDFVRDYGQTELVLLERRIFRVLDYQIQHATLLDLYRSIRFKESGYQSDPSEHDWRVLCEMVYDYDCLRGKSTEDLTRTLEKRLQGTITVVAPKKEEKAGVPKKEEKAIVPKKEEKVVEPPGPTPRITRAAAAKATTTVEPKSTTLTVASKTTTVAVSKTTSKATAKSKK